MLRHRQLSSWHYLFYKGTVIAGIKIFLNQNIFANMLSMEFHTYSHIFAMLLIFLWYICTITFYQMKKSALSIIGFLLFTIGFVSLLLMATGLRLSYLSFIDKLGNLPGLLIRLGMIVIGIVLIYVDRTTTQLKRCQ